ncbi:hypothetical protein [Entomospira culicis]|uniref:Uncharacterized protein n=1 Tax=Entomospira culicis TaxID=2719989 RepID=A0A968GHJ8_9SPIO|nr:hypothetical protein [Entomospira culicis]NIZ18937.1 hypothetical protein [Entomospira culicis]NIZ69152.1 hypothetical protein [Entomospira culicis]WDI37738.1 hypothetical protein PVA46_02850 [Entomospira culicis]WDI39366.1 hypothetical protein PVA47_02855 [Entomospira culicis]
MKQWLVFIAGMVMVGCVPQEQAKERASQPIVSTEEQLMESGEHLSEASNYLDDIANEFEENANDFDLAAEQARDPAMAEYFRGKAARNREEAAIFRARSEAMQREANRASDVANDRSIDE